jgi:hypothetical protein
MTRLLAAPLALAVAAGVAAQPKDDPLDRSTFKLTTTPAAAPVPALKYEFRVRQPDKLPGNAALDYYRAALLVPDWPRDAKEIEKLHAKLDGWEAMPLDELPVEQVSAYLGTFVGGFEALDAAARRETLDWRQGVPLDPNKLEPLFRETGKFREVARLNGFRVRLALARGDHDAAAAALRSGFRLAQAVGEGPVVLNLLVGTAVGAVTVGQANHFVGHPGSPNLYWALVSLPRPVIDPRPALEGEAEFNDRGVKDMIPFAKDGIERWRTVRDEMHLVFGRPYPEAKAAWEKDRARAEALKTEHPWPTISVYALTVPALEKTYYSVARLDRRVAGLTAVETVRLHAAGAGGKAPATLAEVKAVAVPTDPFTGRPFEYAARADGFTLTAPEDPGNPGSGFRYVVTFRP